MRSFIKGALFGVFSSVMVAAPNMVLGQDLIPAKRFVISENTDMPGGDIASIFDTTLEACQRACVTNDKCEAFTFNTRNGSCFPKSAKGAPVVFEGAYSGYVIAAAPGVQDLAKTRRAELLTFVQDWELAAITRQADGLANAHVTNNFTADEHQAAARDAENRGDTFAAGRYMGAALNLTDASADWAEYARILLASSQFDSQQQASLLESAYLASVNAYLRANNKPMQIGRASCRERV